VEIQRVVALAGPNIWSNRRALLAWLDIGRFEDFPSNTLPGFAERLMRWLPSMVEHRCSEGERGGFFQRLVEGTYLGHILEHVALELQTLAGETVGFGRTRETPRRGVYQVVVEYTDEELGRAALETARRLVLAAVDDSPFDLARELEILRDLADRVCLGPGTRAIVQAAQLRTIPFIRLNTGSLVQLGYGNAQRRIWTAETDATSAVAEAVAQNKQLTRQLLANMGLPVPEGKEVNSAEEAWQAASALGLPVVVKPQDANHGRGVSIDLSEPEAIKAAYGLAARESSGVVVERMIPGTHHRILVVDDKVVAASRGETEHVTGDGSRTIRELVDEANHHPMRGLGEQFPLAPIEIDAIALNVLASQGLSVDSRPKRGRDVVLHYNGDLITDVTDELNCEIAAQCVSAARAIGLNIAGIDVITRSIGEPLEPQGGAIIEVNASPGLLPHLKPLYGKARPVGEAIVSSLFGDDEDGRIPIIAVTGTNGKTSTLKLIEAILRESGCKLGVTSSSGVTIDGRTIATGDCTDAPSAKRVLMNPFVDTALFEISGPSVLSQGLAFDKCRVAVVTNLGSGDHLAASFTTDLEAMGKAKRTPVDVVVPDGYAVLNINDAPVADLSKYCKGDVIYFGGSVDDKTVDEMRRAGKRVVTRKAGRIALLHGDRIEEVATIEAIPHSYGGKLEFHVDNALAAVAATWALGINPTAIARGLQRSNQDRSAANTLIFEQAEASIVVSRCRNKSALDALVSAIKGIFPAQKRIAIYAPASDQRPQDAFEQGVSLGRTFDKIVIPTKDGEIGQPKQYLVDELRRGIVVGCNTCVTAECAALTDPITLKEAMKDQLSRQVFFFQASDEASFSFIIQQLTGSGAELVSSGISKKCPAASSKP
jgi:cyanophycin synthetase